MEVKRGYKQTEVGVIPEDWNIHRLGGLLASPPSYGINAPAVNYDSRYPVYLRITDISEGGRFIQETRASVSHRLVLHYLMKEGDLVFARTGASVGKSYLYDPQDGELVYAGFLIRVQPDRKKLKPSYLKHFTHSGVYWNWVKVNSTRSGQPGINGQEFSSLPIPLPPTISEQYAIAEALSDVDAQIARLDQLIAKKRDLKQAAMQQILTGKTRLPGFTAEWKSKRLGEVAEIRTGGTPSTCQPEFWDGNICWCIPTDITDLNGFKYLTQTFRKITTDGLKFSSAELIPANSVVMTSRATIGECAINVVPMATNQGFKSFVPYQETDVEFLYYLLQTKKQDFISLSSGSTFREIGKKQLIAFRVKLPDVKAEQTAIATILSDIDSEIAVLETRRAKAVALKEGMMQELLTGRIRLV